MNHPIVIAAAAVCVLFGLFVAAPYFHNKQVSCETISKGRADSIVRTQVQKETLVLLQNFTVDQEFVAKFKKLNARVTVPKPITC